MKTQQHDGILSQGREGALSLWKEGQCVRTSSVASTGFCRFALSDDQRHCFVGLDEKSKVGTGDYNLQCLKRKEWNVHMNDISCFYVRNNFESLILLSCNCVVELDCFQISCIVADKLNVVNTFQPSDYNQKGKVKQ